MDTNHAHKPPQLPSIDPAFAGMQQFEGGCICCSSTHTPWSVCVEVGQSRHSRLRLHRGPHISASHRRTFPSQNMHPRSQRTEVRNPGHLVKGPRSHVSGEHGIKTKDRRTRRSTTYLPLFNIPSFNPRHGQPMPCIHIQRVPPCLHHPFFPCIPNSRGHFRDIELSVVFTNVPIPLLHPALKPAYAVPDDFDSFLVLGLSR